MTVSPRRAFVRRLGIAVGAGPLAMAASCRPADGPRSEPGVPALAPLTRPVLRAWADDIVHLVAPPHELPVAYVSMALRQVYVDYEFRDRASWLLRAHISVSTALWRIPLPGDPEGQPVVPGDEAREFEELPMRAWDPSLPPSIDDIRIVRGRAGMRPVEFGCVPLAGGEPDGRELWLSAGPLEVPVSDGAPDDTVREDFRIVGTGLRFEDRECSAAGDAVQFVSWAIPTG
jgi:hypothetical protein